MTNNTAKAARCLLTWLCTWAPCVALAHGGPPSAMGLVAASADGPELVLLNEGLAFKTSGTWSFLCPSIWGDLDLSSGKVPLTRSADGGSTWIAGGDGLYLLQDQKIAALRPELARGNLIALGNDGASVFGLHLTGTQSTELVRLSATDEPAIWTSPDYWSALTTSTAGIHLARVAGDKQLELVTIDRQGQELSRVQAMLAATPFEVQLHADGARVYATVTDGSVAQVGYFEAGTWTDVLQATPPIVGPQASADGTPWVAVAGVLGRLQPSGFEPAAESRMVTCLDQWNDWRYVCLGPDLHRLTEQGVGDRIFALEGMYGPDLGFVIPPARDSCDQQWLIYNIDAMRSGLTFTDRSALSEPSSSEGNGGAGVEAAAGSGSAASVPQAGSSAAASGSQRSDGGCSAAPYATGSGRALASLLSAMLLAFCARRSRNRSTVL